MKNALLWCKLVCKTFFLLLCLPFILLWFAAKVQVYKHILKRSMVEQGMPKEIASTLTREVHLSDIRRLTFR